MNVQITNDKEQLLYIQLCTRPTKEQQTIFKALNYKQQPFVRKIKVVTQMQKQKTQHTVTQTLTLLFFQDGLNFFLVRKESSF